MMRRQHIDQRTEAQALGALGDRGEEDARRRRAVERRGVMLAHVVGAKPARVVELDQPQPRLILLRERIGAVIVLVEDAELQAIEPGHRDPYPPARHRAHFRYAKW